MTIPSWPISKYTPDIDTFQPLQRALEPISTDMEGGNTRMRSRPGDNVGTITQMIHMTASDHDTFVAWVKGTLGNGTGRFTTWVWLGTDYENKVCQFVKGMAGLKFKYVNVDQVDVTMVLRVYDV